jgi:hypothetical protein
MVEGWAWRFEVELLTANGGVSLLIPHAGKYNDQLMMMLLD